MLPLGKNCILDLHFLCHRAECETKVREVRNYMAVLDVHLIWCWSINGKCLLFGGCGGIKAVLSKIIFRLSPIFCFDSFKRMHVLLHGWL